MMRTEEDERLFFIGIGLTDSVNFGSAHSLGELEEDDEELGPRRGRGRSLCPRSDCFASRHQFFGIADIDIVRNVSENDHSCLHSVAVRVLTDEVLKDFVAGLTVDDHTHAGHFHAPRAWAGLQTVTLPPLAM